MFDHVISRTYFRLHVVYDHFGHWLFRIMYNILIQNVIVGDNTIGLHAAGDALSRGGLRATAQLTGGVPLMENSRVSK